MGSTHFLALVFSCQILTSQSIAWDASTLSSPVITRNHRLLKGSIFKSFHSVSLVSCGLQCQRHPRCVSINFRKVSFLDETESICELNEWAVELPMEEYGGLEFEEGAVYTKFHDIKVS